MSTVELVGGASLIVEWGNGNWEDESYYVTLPLAFNQIPELCRQLAAIDLELIDEENCPWEKMSDGSTLVWCSRLEKEAAWV